MWLVNNRTPYSADRSWIQDKDANKIWIVVVKATFDIRPDGSTRVSDQQVPVHRTGQCHGKPGESSLKHEADLLWLKPGTDVLLNGSAWPAPGRMTSSVDVELQVGPVRKMLRVTGDRAWRRGIAGVMMSEPEPFEHMPITYERAFGGWDRSSPDPAEHRLETRNPVGTGFLLNADAVIGTRLPNVELPGQLVSGWKDKPEPAGFNAIDCAWTPRRELAGTYDDAWRTRRFPLWAADYDPRYGHCAPADQQVKNHLRGSERVRLTTLSPHGPLQFNLPRIHPTFQTRFGRERVEHRGQLCTVLLEPDHPRVVMAWQTSLVCNHHVDELDMTVVREKRLL